MPAPVYEAQDPNPGLTPLPAGVAPTEGFAAMSQAGQTLAGAGREMDTIAYRFARARDMTNLMAAKAEALQRYNAADTEYSQSPDFKTAPGAYADASKAITGDILQRYGQNLSAPAQAELRYSLAHMDISSGNSVSQAATLREGQTNIANWQSLSQSLGQRYLAAGSDAERAAIENQGVGAVQGLAAAGWVDPRAAQVQTQTFRQNLQEMRVGQIMQKDPALAKTMLADDQAFPAIPAPRRLDLQNGAQAAVDATGALKLQILGKMNPTAAIASAGIVDPNDRATITQIYDHGVIQQESGGNLNVPDSAAGAIGIGQLMPGTARGAALRLGMTNVATMADQDLHDLLRANPVLNRELGLNEFTTLVQRYHGSIPLALAGYNAGPGVADKLAVEAQAKFGPGASAAQIASLAPSAETRAYIPSVYARLGAPADNFGLSGNPALAAQSMALDLGRQEQAVMQRTLAQAAALERSSDPVAQYAQDGYAVDPAKWSAYRQTQQAAAATGDAGATQELRRMDLAERAGPVMRAAWASPPSQLAAFAASETQRLQTTTTWSPADAERLDVVKKVLATQNAMKDTNPVGLAERGQIVPAVPLDFSQMGQPAFGAALAARGPQALQAAAAYDGAILPFKPEEAFQAKQALGNMGPDGKAAAFAQMAANLKDPRVYDAAVSQVAGTRLEAVAGQIAATDPQAAQKLLAGEEMLKDKGVENKILKVREAVTTAYPVGMYPATQSNSDAIEASLAMYAANKGATHALIDENDSGGIKAAIEDVTGKQIKLNGAVTPLPAGFVEGGVRAALANLTDADLKPFGGTQPGIDAAYLAGHAQLMPLRLGGASYAVRVDGQQVKTATGENLIVDLRQFAAAQRARLDAEAHARALSDLQSGTTRIGPVTFGAPNLWNAFDPELRRDLSAAGSKVQVGAPIPSNALPPAFWRDLSAVRDAVTKPREPFPSGGGSANAATLDESSHGDGPTSGMFGQ